MLAKMLAIVSMLALANATDHPVPDGTPLNLTNSTVEPEHGATALNTRAHSSYYCEWYWWSGMRWTNLTNVKTGKAKSFDKCAMKCCKNPYCATFDWNMKSKKCYQYNENVGSDTLNYYDSSYWKSGALTYKNGYSYI